MLEQGLRERDERRVRTSLVLSGLPLRRRWAISTSRSGPPLERSRIETLATCQRVRDNRTLIQGPPGLDKTHLEIAFGRSYRLRDLKRKGHPASQLCGCGRMNVVLGRGLPMKSQSDALFTGGRVRKTGCRYAAKG